MIHLSHPFRRGFAMILCLFILLPAFPAVRASNTEEPSLLGGEGSGLINILLIGRDSESESTSRSDSLILCSFHPESGNVTFTSFLRDLYVPIPGHQSNRINAAYAFGGMELIEKTIRENFSIFLDGCVEVDFSNFPKIIDALGGVTIELRQDEAKTINQKVSGSLSEGVNLLNGSQALAYSRIRNLDRDGDFSRTSRQRKLLCSVLDSYRSASLLTIFTTVMNTLPMVSTNLEKKQILVLTAKLFPLLDRATVHSQRIPADGQYACKTIRNMEVLVADLDTVRDDLHQSLLYSEDSVPK